MVIIMLLILLQICLNDGDGLHVKVGNNRRLFSLSVAEESFSEQSVKGKYLELQPFVKHESCITSSEMKAKMQVKRFLHPSN